MTGTPSSSKPPRSTVSATADGIEVTIPPPHGLLGKLGLLLFLGWWVFGEAMIVSWLLDKEGDFETTAMHAVMALLWTLVGVLAVFSVLYAFTGRERVRVSPSSIVLARDLVGRTRERKYQRSRVSNLRLFDPTEMRGKLDLEVIAHRLAFDHAGELVRFGAHVDDAEAQWILSRLRERLEG